MKLIQKIYPAFVFLPGIARAQFQEPPGTGLPSAPLTAIIQNAMYWILAIAGFFAVIGFLIAGILYITSAGNEERVATAKRALLYSIIGVIVALMGLVVLRAVIAFLGARSVI